jgi:hypothetical protein
MESTRRSCCRHAASDAPPWACSKTRRATRLRLVRPVGRRGRRRARRGGMNTTTVTRTRHRIARTTRRCAWHRHAAVGSAGGLLEDSLRPRLNEGTPFGLAGAAVNTSTLPIRAFPRQPASGVPWLSRGAQPGFAGKPPAAGPTRRHARGGVHTTTRTRTRHRIAGATRCREWNRRAGRVAVTPRLTPPPWACSKTRRATRLRLVRPVGRRGRRRARRDGMNTTTVTRTRHRIARATRRCE